MKPKRKIYFDYNATTPVDKRVVKKMLPYFSEEFGNPSSAHFLGKHAKTAIENSRKKISKRLDCLPEEIIFTNGGTEAENLAIKGSAFGLKKYGNHLITSIVEHHAVECSFEYLSKHGFEVDKVGTDKNGIVNINDIEKIIKNNTILISIMTANNEIGTVQPLSDISNLIKDFNKHRERNRKPTIYFHTDSEAAFTYLECTPKKLGVDSFTINGSKIYGPKGLAVLYVKKGVPVATQICGGGQERFLRGGTENVPGIIGIGEAIKIISKERKQNHKYVVKLRDLLKKEIFKKINNVKLNSPPNEKCLPHIVNFMFKGINAEKLVSLLSRYKIAISKGSACGQNTKEISATLRAIGLSDKEANSSLRFSLGKFNNEEDIKYLMIILPKLVSRLRK